MATFDSAALLTAATGGMDMGSPAGFKMANNALDRSQITAQMGIEPQRLEDDLLRYTLPELASSQAARGAFFSSATARKGEKAALGAQRGAEDLRRGGAFSLAKLGLGDIGASIPGVTF
jgi:hypothetical protein